MALAFKIAVRFLKSSKGQTILIILGIAIGVSVQVFIGSLIQGLQKSLVDSTIGNSSQITIKSDTRGEGFTFSEEMLIEIKQTDQRISTLSIVVDGSGAFVYDDISEPVVIRGFEFEQAEGIYQISERLYEGRLPNQAQEVIIGKELAERLNLSIGDRVSVQVPLKGQTEVVVVGLFDFKVKSINQAWVITTIEEAQGILGYENQITAIEMQVKDVFAADEIAMSLENKLNNDELTIENWKELNEELLSGLQGQSISSYMIQVFVMVSVILGIASVLAITVLQKSKQLGILKAMGITDQIASLIFLFEGFLLGVMGAILGIGFGLGLSFLFTKFAVLADGTPVVALYINPGFIALSAVIAILAATLASILPARRSSKLSIIEVIKNG